MQKRYAKVVEWYGGKDAFLSATNNPISKEVAETYNRRLESLLKKLLSKRSCPLDSFEVKEIISEYGFIIKQLSQIKDEKGLMLMQAQIYRNDQGKIVTDNKYSNGAAEFFANAIEAFYNS